MDYVYVGKLVNTHGIKGEVRIISEFEYKERVFVVDFPIYIGNEKEKKIIKSYRHHKNFEMVTFEGINSINEVLVYKGKNVYINKSDLKLDTNEYLETDLIDMDVYYKDNLIGKLNDIEKNGLNKLMVINDKLIPFNKHFIKNVNKKENKIELDNVEGLLWE